MPGKKSYDEIRRELNHALSKIKSLQAAMQQANLWIKRYDTSWVAVPLPESLEGPVLDTVRKSPGTFYGGDKKPTAEFSNGVREWLYCDYGQNHLSPSYMYYLFQTDAAATLRVWGMVPHEP